MAEDDKWIWDAYWHSDRIASCFTEAGLRNYRSAIGEAWLGFFSALDDGSKVVDLCTGNGAVALFAAQLRQAGKDLDIVAVDQAAIDPARHVSGAADLLGQVRFVPDVNVEQLPFADGSFDAVTSQYGIEYSDLGKSRQEVARILRPGGRFRFVAHAAEGNPVAESVVAVREVDHLLETIGLVGAAERAYEAVCAVERTPAAGAAAASAADRAFEEFCGALEKSAEYADTAADAPMIRNCAIVLFDAFEKRSHVSVDVLMQKAQEVRDRLLAHRHRSAAMIESALTLAEAGALADWFAAATGQPSECLPSLVEGTLVGYSIQSAAR